MKKLLCLIILLFSFIRSEAQSDHICPHEKLYVHTDRANYERGDTVRFRAYLMVSFPVTSLWAIHFVPAIIRFVSIPVIFLLCPLPVTSIVRSLSAGVPFRITARRA